MPALCGLDAVSVTRSGLRESRLGRDDAPGWVIIPFFAMLLMYYVVSLLRTSSPSLDGWAVKPVEPLKVMP